MLRLREYIAESEEHKDGTYASLHLDSASSKSLDQFVKSYGFANPVARDKQHCTVMYSRRHLTKTGSISDKVSIPARVTGFKVLTGDGTSATLVVTLNSPGATKMWRMFRQMGATWDYPSYIPHISVAYNINSKMKLPKLVKKLELNFNRLEITPLALDWKEKAGV